MLLHSRLRSISPHTTVMKHGATVTSIPAMVRVRLLCEVPTAGQRARMLLRLPPRLLCVFGGPKQLARSDPKRLRDSSDRLERRIPPPSFDPTDVGPIEIRLEPQLLLRDVLLLPALPHGASERKQEGGRFVPGTHGRSVRLRGPRVYAL